METLTACQLNWLIYDKLLKGLGQCNEPKRAIKNFKNLLKAFHMQQKPLDLPRNLSHIISQDTDLGFLRWGKAGGFVKLCVLQEKLWGKFNKTNTVVMYKCSYCLQTLKQWLHL